MLAGRGGNGSVAFRREKFVPFGGPSGGDGGRGADIVFVADPGLATLLDLTYGRTLRGEHGEHGQGADCYGRAAKELTVRVPVGTQVFDRDTDKLLYDIDEPGKRVVVARGGKGGRGNIHFATPFDRAPRRSEPGELGEEKKLRLELKVMADVGLLGFPNVGKSTFIRAVSRAQPKVADYPFTTLTPHLGVVRVGDEATFVLADIPGLIPGAAEGAGLGHRFLKHVERCRALLHLITLDPTEGRDPLADYDALRNELAVFDPELSKRPEIVAMSKADITEVREAYPALKAQFAKRKVKLRLVSAATGEGIKELSADLYRLVMGKEIEDWELPRAPRVAEAEEVVEDEKPARAAARPKKKAAPATKKSKTPATKKAAPARKKAAPAKKKAAPTRKKAAPARKKAAPAKKKSKGPAKKKAAPARKKATVARKKPKGRR
ncbi:MAG: GTP-binding protein Obg [Labilithrix sp.]|nr:GTP-binding protein Obg [Labilithrix sp.]